MKIIISLIVLIISIYFSNSIFAQENKPVILKQPNDWRYEKIDFPLEFAPELNYKGFEELRFAKGMFNRSSNTYFTYFFVICFKEKVIFNKKFLKDFLSKYYKGLSASVAKSKKLNIDLSEISVSVAKNKITKKLEAKVHFLDTFNSGEEVILNMEFEIATKKENFYLLALVSPKSKISNIWKELYLIREKIIF